MNWLVRRDILNVARGGVLMGIVNVTPDSFSPSITACWMGAAPLYFGKSDA